MSIKLIINPNAGKGSAFKKSQSIIAELKKRNVDFDYELTNAPREAVGIAREASEKFEKIVAVGGDGTINEVGEGVVGTDSIFFVIPLGSGNDFANELKIPSKVNAAVDLLLKGSVRTIDVIKVNDRISLNTAGVGFNALVSNSVTQIKYLRGLSVYIWGVVKSAVRYEAIPMKIVINDKLIEERIFMVAICNSKREGGGFIVAPEAINDDGLFDVTYIREIGYLKLLLNISSALNGKLNKLDEVETIRSDKITIESEFPMPLHVDGEVVSMNSKYVEASILKGALRVIGN